MKRNILFIFLLLCPAILQAQVELHPKYSSPNMGNGAKLSKDGSKVVAWGGYGFSVWDVQSGKMVYTVNGHLGRVNYAEFNNSGTAIVTASDDYTAKIWNAHNGELIHTLKAHTNLVCYAKFNATDDRIITNSEDDNALLWNVQSGTVIAKLRANKQSYVLDVSFNKKGDKIIMYTSYGVIRIYDSKDGFGLYEYDAKKYWIPGVATNSEVNEVYVKTDVSMLKLTTEKDFEKIALKNEIDSEVKSDVEHVIRVCCLSHNYCENNRIDICNNDKYIVYHRNNSEILVVDTKTGKTVLKEKDTIYVHEYVKFNDSGTLLISISGNGTATVRNTRTWKKVLTLGEKNYDLRSIHSDYSGNTLVTVGENGTTKIYNGKTGLFERELRQEVNVKDEDFDKVKYCFAERIKKDTVAIISSVTGNLLGKCTVQGTLPEIVHYYPKEARFVLWYDTIVELRNSVTGSIVTSLKRTGGCYYNIQFSPSGAELILVTTYDYELRSAFTGKKLYSKEYESPNDSYVTGAYAGKQFVCFMSHNTFSAVNLKNEKKIIEFKGHTKNVHSIDFNKNEEYMVTGSEDSTARVWDVKTGKTISVLKGHKDEVWASFDNEGKRIITTSTDTTTKVWNAFTGELIATLKGHKGFVYNTYFSNDDQTIITRSVDGVLRVYDANELPYSFTDIEEEEIQTTMSLSPNPAQNEIRITFTEPIKEQGEYSIVSPTGMQITKGIIEALSSGFTYRIDKSISNGTYLCIIRTGEKTFEEKFVVIR